MAAGGLGRVYFPDVEDRQYPMASVVAQPDQVDRLGRHYRYWWASGWWGDQGQKPWCVAYSWLHWLADGPVTCRGKQPLVVPRTLYCAAQVKDPWPGDCTNPKYDGAAVRSGAKVLSDLGFVSSYWWAWDVDTVARALLSTGPVVVGTTWFSRMNKVDRWGFLEVGGADEGGHAYILNGIYLDPALPPAEAIAQRRGHVRMKNSWGRRWADRGNALISLENMHGLLTNRGEAVLATEIRPG
jgi:hypothetical protein